MMQYIAFAIYRDTKRSTLVAIISLRSNSGARLLRDPFSAWTAHARLEIRCKACRRNPILQRTRVMRTLCFLLRKIGGMMMSRGNRRHGMSFPTAWLVASHTLMLALVSCSCLEKSHQALLP